MNRFCAVLDASKSGKRVLERVLKQDAQQWDALDIPDWKKKQDEKPRENNPRTLRNPRPDRKPHKPLFLDSMKSDAEIRRDALMREYDKHVTVTACKVADMDLRRPWDAEKQRLKKMAVTKPEIAQMFEEELMAIEQHVKKELENSTTKGPEFTKKPIRDRQDMLRKESSSFVAGPELLLYDPDRVSVLRASCAYIQDFEASKGKSPTRWPWNVAMGELGRIKARSVGGQQQATLLQNLMQVGGLRRLPP
jgi:RNA-dependent RNA polymerase